METASQKSLAAFERIVAERQDWLFRFAYMRIGNREDAEDVVQDVFLRFFQKGGVLDGVESIERYLTRSISNACADYFRSRPQKAMLEIENATNIPEDDSDRCIHEEYVRIGRMLAGLPHEQAETVRLHCIDGLKFHEIAELQELSESTVKSRYKYAVIHIREQIKKQGG